MGELFVFCPQFFCEPETVQKWPIKNEWDPVNISDRVKRNLCSFSEELFVDSFRRHRLSLLGAGLCVRHWDPEIK